MAAAAEVCALGKPVTSLSVTQLKALLAPLKRKDNGTMPTFKADLITKLIAWEGRKEVVIEKPSFEGSQQLVLCANSDDECDNDECEEDVTAEQPVCQKESV